MKSLEDVCAVVRGNMQAAHAIKRLNHFGYGLINMQNKHVLDYGCGSGHVSRALTCYFKEVSGFDHDKSLIEKGRQFPIAMSNLHLTSEFPQEKFHCAVCSDLFFRVNKKEKKKILLTLGHAVIEGGHVVISYDPLDDDQIIWNHLTSMAQSEDIATKLPAVTRVFTVKLGALTEGY